MEQTVGQELAVSHVSDVGPLPIGIAYGAPTLFGPCVPRLAQSGFGARIDPLEGIKGLPGQRA
jgi:hypothetical protein